VTVVTDPVLDGLEEVHGAMLRAGLAHVAGDEAAVLGGLEDAQRTLDDLVADLRRGDPEPGS
jgi:hypothetical protein